MATYFTHNLHVEPLVLNFINNSPRVQGNDITVEVQTSRPVLTFLCALTGRPYQDCESQEYTQLVLPGLSLSCQKVVQQASCCFPFYSLVPRPCAEMFLYEAWELVHSI